MTEQDRVAQVERRDRCEARDDRRDPTLDVRQATAPWRLDDDGTDRPAIGDHRGDQQVSGAGQRGRQEWVALGTQLLHRQDVVALPGPGDDPVGFRGRRRNLVRFMRRQRDHPTLGRAEDDATLEVESVDETGQDDPRLFEGIGDIVETTADLDHRLEVGPALTEFALVQRREGRCRDGEQPE